MPGQRSGLRRYSLHQIAVTDYGIDVMCNHGELVRIETSCHHLSCDSHTHTIDKTLTLECAGCGNSFFIEADMTFASASGDSKIICENCGQLINEKIKVCPFCNLVLNKQHEASRIDNKEYEKIVLHDGKPYQEYTGKQRGGKILIALLLVTLLLAGAGFWFLNTPQHKLQNTFQEPVADMLPNLSGRTETQVVIMLSGQIYYAKKIEHDGLYLLITTKDGAVTKVLKKDILQIAKAVIEE